MGKIVLLIAAVLAFSGFGFLIIPGLFELRSTMSANEFAGHALMTIALLLIMGFLIFLLTQIDTDYI